MIDQNHIIDGINKCLEQKVFTQYSALVRSVGLDYEDSESAESFFGTKRNLQFIIRAASNKRNIFEETLIFDDIALVGSLGGSLGLFVGFSFFGYVTPILEAVFDKVASFFIRVTG